MRYGCLLVVALILAACAGLPPRTLPAPERAEYERAQVAGFDRRIRFYGDETPPFLDEMIDEFAALASTNPTFGSRIDVLALSGGADDGAYGAGFMNGWTVRGGRPQFSWVTGVSTGALMAPFAFLGPEYDPALRRMYTEISADNIVLLRPLAALFGGASIGDAAPLRERIQAEVHPELVRRIAEEHRKGRTLFVGTTNLDAQRPVIWDIGRIAARGGHEAEALIEDILLASASIPGAFPPVAFDVMIDGRPHQELHGDGGVTFNVFAYPERIHLPTIERRAGFTPLQKTLWVIRNTKLEPDYRPVGNGVASITGRAIGTVLKYQGRGDILGVEQLARRDGFVFRLTSVPQDFDVPPNGLFDPDYMRALYERGYRDALSESPWRDRFSHLGENGEHGE